MDHLQKGLRETMDIKRHVVYDLTFLNTISLLKSPATHFPRRSRTALPTISPAYLKQFVSTDSKKEERYKTDHFLENLYRLIHCEYLSLYFDILLCGKLERSFCLC